MWEVIDKDQLEKGVAVVKVWGNIQVEEVRDGQKACPVLGKLSMQMAGKLRQEEIKELF